MRFIVAFIDDTHDPAYRACILISQEQDAISITKGFIFLGIKIGPFVHVNGGDPVGMTFMDPGWKVNE